ncbi:hypothetical protein DFH06DRAFT_757959 [Mycena polygramma]|nr:hypothetical protein DFH06DRAFT_757959 [Mycena polygramma]
MHRCLRIQEILDIIFSVVLHLDDPRWPAALARVCRTFETPALDVLWRTQNTLNNILYTLPSDLTYISRRRVRILRPIVAADWARPLTYTARVRSLTCNSLPDDGMDCDAVHALAMSMPGPCLFPGLQRLKWACTGEEFRYIPVVLAPTLANISIVCQPLHLSVFPTLARTCTALRGITLEMSTPSSGVEILPPLSDLVRRLPDIQSVHLKLPVLCLGKETIRVLANIRNLELLHLNYRRAVSGSLLHSALRIPGFSALRTLEIIDVDVGPAEPLLGMFRDIPLEALRQEMRICVLANQAKFLHESIAGAVTHSSLTTLSLNHAGAWAPTWGQKRYIFHNSCIRPLLCFNKLTSVWINSPLGLHPRFDGRGNGSSLAISRAADPAIASSTPTPWTHARVFDVFGKTLSSPRTPCAFSPRGCSAAHIGAANASDVPQHLVRREFSRVFGYATSRPVPRSRVPECIPY